MLADADVVLRSFSDPALPWEVHRHATHALLVSPLGGLVAALPFLLTAASLRARFTLTLVAATLAYATHGLLDACTSYGTSLLLPFSAARAAWDVIAIVDPLFTLPLLAGALVAAWRLRRLPAIAALAMCAAYLALGARQHALAMQEVHRFAAARGHIVERARALPTPMNLVVWRGLYVAEGRIYADGGRVPLFGAPRFEAGTSLPLFLPEAGAASGADPRAARIADVVARFERFSDGFVARDPARPDILADMRYSLEVTSFAPLWGIRVGAAKAGGDPVSWADLAGDRRASLRRMWEDLRRH
jgi:inner membrane protein